MLLLPVAGDNLNSPVSTEAFAILTADPPDTAVNGTTRIENAPINPIGRVVSGMNVVAAIASAPTSGMDNLVDPITIYQAQLLGDRPEQCAASS